jgi:hypothetical protein
MSDRPDDRDALAADGIVEAGEAFSVANEFTSIRVRKVRTRTGERLELTNVRTGVRTLLDPMQLEIIALQRPEVFTALLAEKFAEPREV